MLTSNIDYYKPMTIKEALETFYFLKAKNKRPIYYAGGTEIITLGRLNLVETDALIDIKDLKECQLFEFNEDYLIAGAALLLTHIEEKNLFPLLSKASMEIADRTARNKITLGGNLCGQIFYREAVLPFLLCDSQVVVAGYNGIEAYPIEQIFNQNLQLQDGQLLIQLLTEKKYINLPYMSIKKRQQWDTGYPLLTIASIKSDNQLRFAFSGLCPFPFRSKQMEAELNNTNSSVEERIQKAIQFIPGEVLDDIEGTKEYRLFVLKNTIEEIILEMEGR
ncbi:FAD binding domain-containing protein [Gottfriedia acidiceleris]|uniref:FAD binding domain-containing protein n=1 Tax=Gottfriedia acidiceleris TaxID=371036 RepID=A0ABY4JLZ8_9BACI|nr:FAD binding domain-containing protein [Gottfriedia acidiceleris]UPM53345.1 FAD binding domain-containing protein [Gottfriedia acidiceleris]